MCSPGFLLAADVQYDVPLLASVEGCLMLLVVNSLMTIANPVACWGEIKGVSALVGMVSERTCTLWSVAGEMR
ncbi:MAG: hypothetical protein BWY63_01102 [Chloroflexi bacterium ADurb.Bin360]|nr:MAG: hypothetical protein BWY63_01102 [Chloroflexi bacterium ADurb.Bin360]